MYKVIVTKNGIVTSVQYNRNAERCAENARLEFGDDYEYRIEDCSKAEEEVYDD